MEKMEGALKISPKYFKDQEAMASYLSEALRDSDPARFLEALATVAKSYGITRLARESGLGRESLYKSLRPGANPRYQTVLKIFSALGLKINFDT